MYSRVGFLIANLTPDLPCKLCEINAKSTAITCSLFEPFDVMLKVTIFYTYFLNKEERPQTAA